MIVVHCCFCCWDDVDGLFEHVLRLIFVVVSHLPTSPPRTRLFLPPFGTLFHSSPPSISHAPTSPISHIHGSTIQRFILHRSTVGAIFLSMPLERTLRAVVRIFTVLDSFDRRLKKIVKKSNEATNTKTKTKRRRRGGQRYEAVGTSADGGDEDDGEYRDDSDDDGRAGGNGGNGGGNRSNAPPPASFSPSSSSTTADGSLDSKALRDYKIRHIVLQLRNPSMRHICWGAIGVSWGARGEVPLPVVCMYWCMCVFVGHRRCMK